jgi:hypothetical protein
MTHVQAKRAENEPIGGGWDAHLENAGQFLYGLVSCASGAKFP